MTKLSSVALALLLAFGVVWGECASCPLISPEKKSCCSGHSGNCKMPSPKPKPAKALCPNVALAPVSHQAQNSPVLIAVAPVAPVVVVPVVSFEPVAYTFTVPDTGPPDLYLLNSTLLV